MSGLLEKYHICDISSTWKRVVPQQQRRSKKYCMYVCTFGYRANHPRRFIQRYLYILAPICPGYSKSIIYAI